MKLSVIIPCAHSLETLPVQLDALARQSWNGSWEVIISDNGPTAGLSNLVETYRDKLPGLCLIDSSSKAGASHARNIAAEIATGDYLLFCDSDDMVDDNWVAALADALTQHDFVASRLWVDKINEPWVIESRPMIRETQRDGLMNFLGFLPWAGAGTLGIKRSIFLATDGFDESLPALEDVDFCWRVQLAGTELHFEPQAVIHYRLRSGLSGIYRQAAFYAEHQVFVLKKFGPHGLDRPPFSWHRFLRGPQGWGALIRRLPTALRKRPDTGAWLWNFGWRVGLLKGSLKHRYFIS